MATPFMNLTLPTVTVTAGPEWASQLNTAITTIDAHDHTSGKGMKIIPAAMNINEDLEFNGYSATELKSTRFDNQAASLNGVNDVRCLYVSGSDLFYNNGTGTAVQITSGGGLNAASIGGIGGDYATSSASVSYSTSSKTFTFTQASNAAAHLDAGNVVLREATASANGVTLKSPTTLSASYNFIYPTGLPGAGETKLLSIDSSGQVGAAVDGDNSTIELSGTSLRVKDAGIVEAKIGTGAVTEAKIGTGAVTETKLGSLSVSTAKIQSGAVTQEKLGAANVGVSSSSGTFNTTSTSYVDVTNLSVSVTTTGRPVRVYLIAEGNAAQEGRIIFNSTTGNVGGIFIRILRDGSEISKTLLGWEDTGVAFHFPPSLIQYLDQPSAGSYTYKVQARAWGSSVVHCVYSKLVVEEI